MASRCVRGIGRRNPSYVGDLLQDEAKTQSSIFAQKMLLCCSRPIMFETEKTVQPSQCAAQYNVHQLEFEFCIEQFSPISLSYFNNVTISILQASASCDRDLQLLGSLHLLSVQLFSDSESYFHGPSEDT